MYCSNCGNLLNDNDKFCSRCGNNSSSNSNNKIEKGCPTLLGSYGYGFLLSFHIFFCSFLIKLMYSISSYSSEGYPNQENVLLDFILLIFQFIVPIITLFIGGFLIYLFRKKMYEKYGATRPKFYTSILINLLVSFGVLILSALINNIFGEQDFTFVIWLIIISIGVIPVHIIRLNRFKKNNNF